MEILDGRLTTIGWDELRFRAMGTHVHLAALGDDPRLLAEARERIDALEDRWSRFRPDSVLSRLNRAEGAQVEVDQLTFDLLVTAVGAWHRTGHRFDPTILDALEAAGYDRSFELLGTGPGPAPGPVPRPPGCAGIHLDPARSAVALPPGVRLDLGGIAKGRTADLVAAELVAAGARSAMVNLGGDLRIAGEQPDGGAFTIVVEDPADTRRVLTTVDLGPGALATSSSARRRWTVGGEARHHLIDPATGRSADQGLASVTVIADEATKAEVLAKATLVAGPKAGSRLLADEPVAALLVTDTGVRRRVGGFEGFER